MNNKAKYPYRKKWADENGKIHDIKARTKKELDEKVKRREKEILEEALLGKKKLDRVLTVKEWGEEWLAIKEKRVGPKTINIIKTCLNRIFDYMGDMKLQDVRPSHCADLLAGLERLKISDDIKPKRSSSIRVPKTEKSEQLSKSYLNKIKFYMGAMFEAAKENWLVHENPAKASIVEIPKNTAEYKGHRALTEHERAIFLKVCETHEYGLWGLVMFYCGLRSGETALLRKSDFDLSGRILHVPGTKTDNAPRDIPIPKKLLERLEIINMNPLGFVFTNKHGDKLSESNIQRRWDALWKAMHIEDGGRTDYDKLQRPIAPYPIDPELTAYCLRHNFCTMCAEAGVPLATAAKWMGHSDQNMTYRIYTHVTGRIQMQGVELLDAFHAAI